MNEINIKEIIERLHINSENIPTDYCWSGYTNNITDFEEANFYKITEEGNVYLLCSEENAISLCEFLSNKLIKQQCMWDTEEIYSPGCNIWFYFAWEMMLTFLDELPQWIQDIVEYLSEVGMIQSCNIDGMECFVLINPQQYVNDVLPGEYVEKIEQICRKGVIEYWNDCLEEVNDNIDELLKPECGSWGLEQFELYVEDPEYDIMVSCISEDGHSIGFGITLSYRELLFQDDVWVYEGMSDSLSENWQEFKDIVARVEEQGIAYYRANNISPGLEEVKKLVHKLLNKTLGDFAIIFEVNEKTIKMNYKIDVNNAIYDLIIRNFAIDSGIIQELKK